VWGGVAVGFLVVVLVVGWHFDVPKVGVGAEEAEREAREALARVLGEVVGEGAREGLA
jgi:hypothetical protein